MLGSLWVSWTFLSMSPCFSWVCLGPGCVYGAAGWLGPAVMSVSMEEKKHTGCQTWKSIKKGEGGRGRKGGREGGEGTVEWRRNVILQCSWRWNLDLTPSLHLWIVRGNFWLLKLAKSSWKRCICNRGVLSAGQVSDAEASLAESWIQSVCAVVWGTG